MERIMNREDITRTVHGLNLQDDSVVMEGGSLVALGIERQGVFGTMELEVGSDTYRALRETDGWRDDGENLRHGNVLARIGASQMTTDRDFRLNGINYEGLPHMYGMAQAVGDTDITDTIRNYLWSAEAELPDVALAGELRELEAEVAQSAWGAPEIRVAVQGLYAVRTLYGSLADPNSVNTYQGMYETRPVAAILHAYEHTRHDVVGGVIRYNAVPGAMNERQFLSSLAGAANHDLIMGFGRQADNPEAYDEKLSAELVRDQLLRRGATEESAEAAYQGVMATAWNEAARRQNVRPEAGFVTEQVALAGSDLSRQSLVHGSHNAFLAPLENLQRRNFGWELNDVAIQARRDTGLVSPEVILGAIDEDDETRQSFAKAVAGNGDFTEYMTVPDGWSLDSPDVRLRNASLSRNIARRIMAGSSALAEYENLKKAQPAPWTVARR